MATDKPFKNIEEQLDILTHRGLRILNMNAAAKLLTDYGYYEIINGYKYPFLIDKENDDAGFKEEASFEHIFGLYQFDANLRDCVISAIERFEDSFKQSLAYVVSSEISDEFANYTNSENFVPGNINKRGKSDRDFLIKKFNSVESLDHDPYKHYKEHHGNVPPWILVKGLSLGQTMYFFNLLKEQTIKEKVIARMTGQNINTIKVLDEQLHLKQAFGDSLNLILAYRNLSAHGGRVYNYRSQKHQITTYSPFLYNNYSLVASHSAFQRGEYRSSVRALLSCLTMMENTDPFINLRAWINVRINDHLKNYPEDEDYLRRL